MRRIITRGLRPENGGFLNRFWLNELESLLANHKILAKRMAGV